MQPSDLSSMKSFFLAALRMAQVAFLALTSFGSTFKLWSKFRHSEISMSIVLICFLNFSFATSSSFTKSWRYDIFLFLFVSSAVTVQKFLEPFKLKSSFLNYKTSLRLPNYWLCVTTDSSVTPHIYLNYWKELCDYSRSFTRMSTSDLPATFGLFGG